MVQKHKLRELYFGLSNLLKILHVAFIYTIIICASSDKIQPFFTLQDHFDHFKPTQ